MGVLDGARVAKIMPQKELEPDDTIWLDRLFHLLARADNKTVLRREAQRPLAGTVYLILTVTGARLTGNSWLATGWTGTMRLVSEPRTGLFGTGCASSIVSFLLTAVPAPG
jgi:hypothetical protein